MKVDNIIIVPITATNAAGKTEIAKRLSQYFETPSISAREILVGLFFEKYNRKPCYQNELGEFSNQLRQQVGVGCVFGGKVAHILRNNIHGVHVFESIRCTGEVENIEYICESYSRGTVKPIAIDAPLEMRYQRIVSRSQDFKTPKTFEQFVKDQQEEYDQQTEPWQMNIKKCMELVPLQGHFQNLDGALDETIDCIIKYILS